MQQRLIVFTRYPEPGRTKTRLIPALGADGAAALSRRLTRETLDWAARLAAEQIIRLEIHFEGGDVARMEACFGPGLRYRPQVEGGLGARLTAALDGTTEPTVVIGTDCPELRPAHILQAFLCLRSSDVVVGPAKDGGYYLIGLNRPAPALFVNVPWSSKDVFRRTRESAADLGLKVALLDALADVDRPEDLHLLGL